MRVFVALSGDCCGSPFEGLFLTLDEAKAAVERNSRPEGVEEWEIEVEVVHHAPYAVKCHRFNGIGNWTEEVLA